MATYDEYLDALTDSAEAVRVDARRLILDIKLEKESRAKRVDVGIEEPEGADETMKAHLQARSDDLDETFDAMKDALLEAPGELPNID